MKRLDLLVFILFALMLYIECFQQQNLIENGRSGIHTLSMGKIANRRHQNIANFEQAISIAVITPASSVVPNELNILSNICDNRIPQLLTADEYALFARESKHQIAIPFINEDCYCMYFDNKATRDKAFEKIQEFLTFYREQFNNEVKARRRLSRRRDPNDSLLFTKGEAESDNLHMLRVSLLGYDTPQLQPLSKKVDVNINIADDEDVDDLDIMQGTRPDLSSEMS